MGGSGPKKSVFVKVVGYAALAFVVFLLGLWLLFPYDQVARRGEAELAKRGIEAEITGLGPRTPLSYNLKSLKISRAMGKEVNILVTDAVIRLSLGSIFDGRVGVEFDGGFMGGRVVASAIVPAPERVNLAWREMEIAPVANLFSEKEVPINGRTEGTATVELPYDGYARLDATVDANVANLTFGPYTVMGFTTNPIGLGSGKVRAEVQKGKARIYDTRLTGGDISSSLDGTVQMLPVFAQSKLELTADLKASPEFEKEYFMILSLLSPYKNSSGSFNVSIGGTAGSPTVRPR